MENSPHVMQNPTLGIAQTLLTFVAGMTAMEVTQGVVSIIAGLLTICLLLLQIRKVLKNETRRNTEIS